MPISLDSKDQPELHFDALAVGNMRKLKRIADKFCSESPNTLLKIDENTWHVVPGNKTDKISNILGEFCQPISVQTLADQCHITECTRSPITTSERAEQFSATHVQGKLTETYWSQRLANFEPYQLSFAKYSALQPPIWEKTSYQNPNDSNAIEILVAWFIYIARDTKMSKVQIGWDATEHWQKGNEASSKYMFARTVPFEVFINLNDTFEDVMASIKGEHKQLINHLPYFSTLIRHGRTLWPLVVSIIDAHSEHENSKIDTCELELHTHGSLMTLQINKKNGAFRWIYDINQITEREVNRVSSHLLTLLASAHSANEANKAVAKLNLLPEAERDLLLKTWNLATVAYSTVHCLHQLFEAQVERDGTAIAVEYKGETISYAELNVQANRLAHYLIVRGVKPDDRIALCVERSTTMIVAILGILKAGGAYLPLDPVHTGQRLNNILNDADPIFLLADAIGQKALGDHQVPVIDLDKPLPIELSIDNPDTVNLGVTPSNLAYVIYTSGSTGTPKGVMVEHNQAALHIKIVNDRFGFNKQDKWCLFHSFSFDISVWEIWGAFYNGSQLSIVPHDHIHSTDEFYDWICSSGITVLIQSPSSLKMLLRAKNISSLSDRMRYIFCGGEALDSLTVEEWHENFDTSQTVLVNVYGPTEAVIDATSWICDITISEKSFVPIGRPLSQRIYLLDAHGEPVPLGAEGEIYIGGDGIARGYLNRPELTDERFLPDPFNETPAARMYRTGDRARYLPDGNLVYLGRTDQQVKIRGFRIEPGEIEAHLIKHPQVQETVVQPYGNGSDARLVAYVVACRHESLAHELRSYLSSLLPDYMVPVAYVCLPFLPLTPNGKLDRRVLPAPDDEAFAREQYEAPQGEMEEKLADIWCELLGIERISREDNFFALGGNSLLIVQLLAQLRQKGLDTTVRQVFNTPNLAMLASTFSRYQAVIIPPNLITTESTVITPDMLPLITLSQSEIDSIIAHVPGGVTNVQDIYGLAPLQNGMLFHHLMAEKGDPYLIFSRMKFTDRMTLERYADALQKVIQRHEILRTIFMWKGLNESAQVVLRKVPSVLTEITLNDTDDTDVTVLEQLNQQFNPRHYRLDLTQAPLLRLIAAPTSDGSWVAIRLMHHIIGDHTTEERLNAEIHAIFDGQSENLTIPKLFREVVSHARLRVKQDEHTRFFSEMLGDIDEPTLPFGLSDVGRDGAEMNEAQLLLPQVLNDQLRAYARKLHVSLASIIHLAWAQLLARASGRESVVFGTVLLGRLQDGEGSLNTIGLMMNTLPLRLDIDEISVRTAVCHTHDRLSALLAHEYAPLVLAQRCSGIPAGVPLFSALLNYRHNQQTGQVSLPGVSVLDFEERTNYPLSLSVDDSGDSLGLVAVIISPMSATRICAYMQQALVSLADALTHSPQQPVRTLTVMPPEERTLLLHTWNPSTISYSPAYCLHQLFEAQVERDGTAIAVEYKGETLSYAELNVQANRLAHYLIALGVKPDDRIALCVKRGTTMIVAILGILKAGGAYLPLDPVYTSQRLINILHDADPTFLLADAIGQKALGNHQVPVIDLNKPLPADFPIYNPDATKLGLTTSNLAYIIYTSGSTGTPKGVMVEHQHVAVEIKTESDKFGFNKQDKWCLFHSFSFDSSVWEIWGAFYNGSQLSIVPTETVRSTDEFYDWICINGITVIGQTPSALKLLIRSKNITSRSDQLRYVCCGGEAMDASIVREWNEKFDEQTVLVNMYGPTETVIDATSYICDMTMSKNSLVPIGRPLSNTLFYLLDTYGEPALLGAEGEMYIGGASVARGYLNRPELTAERFLPDPFSNEKAARIYRTGDRARYLPDGNLVYLGRIDQQVKIRGFRIELGEIEARLVENPKVYEAVVQPHGNGSDASLVAYVVANPDKSLAHDLRSYLSNLLPDYMVPVAYVCLPSLPLTPNGKLDRRALPAPDVDAFARQQYEAPQDEMEKKLAEIWCELLSIECISRHDNFFELGGHSLLVMHFASKAKLCNIHIDARCVFSFPILKDLAKQITNRSNRLYCDSAIPVRQYGNEIPIFMLPDCEGDISHAFELAHDININIPIYVLPWLSPESKQPSSIEEMADSMITLIRKVQANGPCSIAGYSAGGILAYEITKQLINNGYPVSFLGLIDTCPPIANTLTETESFLITSFVPKFSAFNLSNDSNWWDRLSKLTLDDAVDEIKKTNINLKNTDIEWEALLSKQRHNYLNICAAYKIDSIPIEIHLFRAKDKFSFSTPNEYMDNIYKKYMDFNDNLYNLPKLGWENYNTSTDFHVIDVDGNHLTMITDPTNRTLLGKKITKSLESKAKKYLKIIS